MGTNFVCHRSRSEYHGGKEHGNPKQKHLYPKQRGADLLAAFDPEVRNLVLATRGFVFQMFPDITEQVDAKARIIGYGYGPKYTDMVCAMMPTKIKAANAAAIGRRARTGQKAKR